ncbi:MAG: glycosyltransferase family 4 protein [Chloroflexi bacterium]|nr:glycosyltransferase family 4 protein [Chloroflexota bacterium]
MRILFVIPRYWPSVGGAQLLTRQMVQRLSTEHAVKIITHQADGSFIDAMALARPNTYADGLVSVQRIGPDALWRPLLRSLARLYTSTRLVRPITAWVLHQALVPCMEGIIHDFQPDVLHAIHIGLVYSSEIAQQAARRQNVGFVWTPLPHIVGDGWRGPRFRRLYQSADRLIAMTDTERQWLIHQGAAAERVSVIPFGPLISRDHDAAAFRARHDLGDALIVLFLGQKLPYKGFAQMAEAAPLVWQEHPHTRFVFVGPRTAESTAFFATLHDPRILELPAIDEFEKNSALAACDIFCMPSTQESLGGVYLEAWSYAKPVIAADIPTSQEIISHGTDGLLVEQKGTAIAAALIGLLADPEQAAALGAAGQRKVAAVYVWEGLAGRLLDLYRSVADKRG